MNVHAQAMARKRPIYDSYRETDSGEPSGVKKHSVKLARSLSDIMEVTAVRAAVYLGEQNCPYGEEFDGNDFCSAHLIGYVQREPVACLRIRYFADFVKLERLAVRHEFRKSRIAFKIVRSGIEFARKKGYCNIYGHVHSRLTNFWTHFGATPMNRNRNLVFSDFEYTEMLLEMEPHPEPITLHSDPYVIIRPEGAWDEPGVLDQSSDREATTPLRDMENISKGAAKK